MGNKVSDIHQSGKGYKVISTALLLQWTTLSHFLQFMSWSSSSVESCSKTMIWNTPKRLKSTLWHLIFFKNLNTQFILERWYKRLLSQKRYCFSCCQMWHHQLLDLKSNYFFTCFQVYQVYHINKVTSCFLDFDKFTAYLIPNLMTLTSYWSVAGR